MVGHSQEKCLDLVPKPRIRSLFIGKKCPDSVTMPRAYPLSIMSILSILSIFLAYPCLCFPMAIMQINMDLMDLMDGMDKVFVRGPGNDLGHGMATNPPLHQSPIHQSPIPLFSCRLFPRFVEVFRTPGIS